MANLKDIKRRISSVNNTAKTTRAMKLVSTSKLKSAEQQAKASREYANKLSEVLHSIAYRIYESQPDTENRFFSQNIDKQKADIIFITANKGLCGAFNYATIKETVKMLQQFKKQKVKVRLRGIGKKGLEYFKYQGIEIFDESIDLGPHSDYKDIKAFMNKSIDSFLAGHTDSVHIVYNGYKNMITQQLRVSKVLPVDISQLSKQDKLSYLEFEPDDNSILESLLAKYVEYSFYYALVDSLAAEHSARMQAMDTATTNAIEMVDKLTLQYNKARQSAITTELIEIISGMEALK